MKAVAFLLAIVSVGCSAPVGAEHADQCDSGDPQRWEQDAQSDGHFALLSTKAVRTKVVGGEVVENSNNNSVLSTFKEPPRKPLSRPPLLDEVDTKASTKQRPKTVEPRTTAEAADPEGGIPYPDHPELEGHDQDYVQDDDGPYLFRSPWGAGPGGTVIPDEEHKEHKHALARYVVIPVALVIFLVFTIVTILERFEIFAIPESAIMILIGVVLGFFLKMYAPFSHFSDPSKFGTFVAEILNLVLLPIIMFASGWSIRRQDFFSQFPYILIFAFMGVGLSTVAIGCMVYFTGMFGLHQIGGLRTAFVFAAFVSATDPVATLATYQKLRVEPLLNILVFGESVINDAVAIVLFHVLNSDQFMVGPNGRSLSFLELCGSIGWGIVKIFGCSVGIGIALGAIYVLVANLADMSHNKKGQILVLLASAYLTYAIAEGLGMSGIIATIFAALLMGVYMRPHLSSEGSLLATFFLQQLATLADTCVFLLVGVATAHLTTKGWKFGVWAMIFCLIGRAVSTVPCALLSNGIKEGLGRAHGVPREGWHLIENKHIFMMWHAGLRGAIAMALSLDLGPWVDVLDGPGTRRALQTATFLLICVFLLLFGGTTTLALKACGISMGRKEPADALSRTELQGPLLDVLRTLDRKIFAPLLLGHGDKHYTNEGEDDLEELLRTSTPTVRSHGIAHH